MTQVWCANIFSDMTVFAPYAIPASTSDERNAVLNLAALNQFGFALSPQDIPARVLSMRTPPKPLKDYVFISADIPMVSPRLAAVLRLLDIGASQFFSTEFFAEDGITPMGHAHLFWSLANRKDTLVPSECRGIFQMQGQAGQKVAEFYSYSDPIKDDDLAVRAEALAGADFWVEKKFSRTVFFTARFERVMSENGFQDLFPLKSVRVV